MMTVIILVSVILVAGGLVADCVEVNNLWKKVIEERRKKFSIKA